MKHEARSWPPMVAGLPCLDFVNTIDPRLTKTRHDYLPDYASLLEWSVHALIINRAASSRLGRQASRHMAQGRDAFKRAILFREALYVLALGIARGRRASRTAQTCVADTIRRSWQHTDLVACDGHYSTVPIVDLELPVTILALGAERLLTSNVNAAVCVCHAPGCGWLFIDTSKGHRRRWCSMKVCGNREKARRYARRHHATTDRITHNPG